MRKTRLVRYELYCITVVTRIRYSSRIRVFTPHDACGRLFIRQFVHVFPFKCPLECSFIARFHDNKVKLDWVPVQIVSVLKLFM